METPTVNVATELQSDFKQLSVEFDLEDVRCLHSIQKKKETKNSTTCRKVRPQIDLLHNKFVQEISISYGVPFRSTVSHL